MLSLSKHGTEAGQNPASFFDHLKRARQSTILRT